MCRFRIATIDDFCRVKELNKQVHRVHFAAEPGFFRDAEYPMQLDFFKAELAQNRVYVLESNSEVIGYVIYHFMEPKDHPIIRDQKIFFIDDICIDQSNRRLGFGKSMYDEILILAKDLNCTSVELTVWSFNQDAVAFYEAMNMRKTMVRMKRSIE